MCNASPIRVPHLCKAGMNIFLSIQDDLEDAINVKKGIAAILKDLFLGLVNM